MKYVTLLKNAFYNISVVLLIIGALLVVAGRFGIGDIRALVVQSGSMEPTIPTRSIVITAPVGFYDVNDIITFKQSGRNNVLVTHRVTEKREIAGMVEYTTKGDANEESDAEAVPSRDVIGKVIFSIPFVGTIVSFAQTTPGFIALIVVPSVLIIYSELMNIRQQISNYLKKRKRVKLIRPLE